MSLTCPHRFVLTREDVDCDVWVLFVPPPCLLAFLEDCVLLPFPHMCLDVVAFRRGDHELVHWDFNLDDETSASIARAWCQRFFNFERPYRFRLSTKKGRCETTLEIRSLVGWYGSYYWQTFYPHCRAYLPKNTVILLSCLGALQLFAVYRKTLYSDASLSAQTIRRPVLLQRIVSLLCGHRTPSKPNRNSVRQQMRSRVSS
ncbi:hypothetical protein JTE90_000379 [Oedothorax gibbosus]|uniref:Uncharacterized protein n=1 Tax=Oedothorax gibbosus TaxID=931172 RepID=A0AAV6TSL6_9ARAC|nr:hypothetical protein JTE90_000379 [Oedothorax gibbosus]